MPLITDFSHFLETKVLKKESGLFCKFGLPIIPQIQHGQVCKLNALSVVMNSLNQFRGMPKPLPLRKNKGEFTYSLRQHAKEKYDSQVGEVYSAKILASIAKDNGFVNSSIYREDKFANYVARIISSIGNDEAPIIFIDIDKDGEPTNLSGNREHAAVVAGYFFSKENELCFIVSQWGNYYWMKASDVYMSTSQLSESRAPEVFFKYDIGWHDVYSMKFHPPEIFVKPPSEKRKAKELPPEDGGLKNKILVIHHPSKILNKNSFWSNPHSLTTKESENLLRSDLIRKNIPYSGSNVGLF
ncbi:hypothetical protein BN59_01114 [Legionella massiliensis]|uniref:Peptidase C39-like domain-containing protein n=1 Tax=Legionella massiliensis TaxID=1034943 RepID=A0A078KYM6_9GAMM|nr:hypothetical protein [Legionella massiliensis]CDZ76838.1 hypothetical protein BN59_01114 [Legionella massiliensis]CEE12576.1 hypothetical protein BN1094_01114 [Legionella massiliensis]